MEKLKEAYDIKRQLIADGNINELGDILKENSNINVVVNSDNTIYLESNCGIDSIKNDLDESIKKWVWVDNKMIRSIIFNTLPISNNSCIVKF